MTLHTVALSAKKLSTKQQRAVLALAQGYTIEQAAAASGASSRSIHYWKKLNIFREAIDAAEDEIFRDALRLLKRSTKAAVTTLIQCMSADSKKGSYTRVNAASKLLEVSIQVHEIGSIRKELDELKELLGARNRSLV